MKKTLLSILGLSLLSLASFAQCGTQFTLKQGLVPNTVEVWMTTDFTDAQVKFSNITFTLSIENTGTILTTPTVEDQPIADMPFVVSSPLLDITNPTSRIYYDITASNSNSNPSATTPMAVVAGTEFKVVTIAFENGIGNSIIQINDFSNGDGISIPAGGLAGNSYAYASIVTTNGFGCDGAGAITNTNTYTNLFYSTPGTSATGVFGTSEFVATINAIPLPVTVSSFNAQNVKNSAALLSWNVEQEDGIATYEIEQGTDGRVFDRSIGITAATGAHQYTMTDNAPVAGDNYYRLKATGKDGKTSFTVRKVTFDALDKIVVSPTLTNDVVNVTLPESYKNAQIEVINAVGQKVDVKIDGTVKRTVSLNNLAAGAYILRIQSGNHVESHKIQLVN